MQISLDWNYINLLRKRIFFYKTQLLNEIIWNFLITSKIFHDIVADIIIYSTFLLAATRQRTKMEKVNSTKENNLDENGIHQKKISETS